jgi:hypothetical protein
MVMLHALSLAVEFKVDLPGLRSWITVGTPFLHYKPEPKRILVSELGIIVLVFVFLAVGLALWARQIRILADATWALGLVVALWRVWRIRSGLQQTAEIEAETIRIFGGRWIGVMSRNDEAVALIRESLRYRRSLIPRRQDSPFWEYTHPDVTRLPGRLPRRVMQRKLPGVSEPEWRQNVRSWVLMKMFFWPFDMLNDFLSLLYNTAVAPRIDRAFGRYAAFRVLGNDSLYYSVKDVSEFPSISRNLDLRMLPSFVEDKLVRLANAGALNVTALARQHFISRVFVDAESELFVGLADPGIDATRALVHCRYFDVPEIVKFFGDLVSSTGHLSDAP